MERVKPSPVFGLKKKKTEIPTKIGAQWSQLFL
jgi:hypothetical protein